MIAGYLIFESIPINYRPIPINGVMEASYPSSTTLLVLSVMPTLNFQVKRRIENRTQKRAICAASSVYMNCIVNTGDSRNAAVRIVPGLNAEIIGSLPNGTVANTTGRFVRADGRNWAEIDYPMYGWIKGSILGFEY